VLLAAKTLQGNVFEDWWLIDVGDYDDHSSAQSDNQKTILGRLE
jgi:hypothetical protein